MAFISNSNDDDLNDVELMFPGDRFPVVVGEGLRMSGWRGGIFVQYVTGYTDFLVEISDGNNVAGFILFPSENYELTPPVGTGPGSNANFTSGQMRTGPGGNNVITMSSGGTRAFFRIFETEALTGGGTRTGGPITYSLNDDLKISENGLLCNDSDGNLAAAGVATPKVVGICSAVPTETNLNRLCIDLKF